jgi:hypothetical protein
VKVTFHSGLATTGHVTTDEMSTGHVTTDEMTTGHVTTDEMTTGHAMTGLNVIKLITSSLTLLPSVCSKPMQAYFMIVNYDPVIVIYVTT